MTDARIMNVIDGPNAGEIGESIATGKEVTFKIGRTGLSVRILLEGRCLGMIIPDGNPRNHVMIVFRKHLSGQRYSIEYNCHLRSGTSQAQVSKADVA